MSIPFKKGYVSIQVLREVGGGADKNQQARRGRWKSFFGMTRIMPAFGIKDQFWFMPAENDDREKKNRFSFFRKYSLIGWLLVIALLMFSPMLCTSLSRAQEVSWLEFSQKILAKGAVERIIVVNQEYAEVYIKKELAGDSLFRDVLKPLFGKEPNPGPHYTITVGSAESFERKLEAAQVKYQLPDNIPVTYVRKSNGFGGLLTWIIPLLLIFFLWRFMFRSIGSGGAGGSSMFSFGKSTATLLDKESRSKVTFDDVAGLDEAELEVRKLVNEAYRQTKNILLKNRESLNKVAELLLQKEVIFKEDLDKVILPAPPDRNTTMTTDNALIS